MKDAVLKELNTEYEKLTKWHEEEKQILETLREYSNVDSITCITIGLVDGLGLALESLSTAIDNIKG